MVRNNWGGTYRIISEAVLADRLFASFVGTPFWDVKEGLSEKWKISGPWHVVTLTFMMTLIDVLDDTLQNTLPRNLGHCSPEEKRQKKTWGWGWSSELGYPRESPEAAAYLCVGGSKVWALSDVCSTVIICFKLFSWENNKIIICLSRQINWASVGGMRPSSELLFSFCFHLIGPTRSLVNLFIFSPTTTVGHSDVLPQ